MTGLEMLALGTGAVSVHEANKKYGWTTQLKETVSNPIENFSLSRLFLTLLLGLIFVAIWQTILKGYITE